MSTNHQNIIHALFEWGNLRLQDHVGWKRIGIEQPESVAAHSHRTALIAYVLAKLEGADAYKCAMMALVHDLGEIRIGDHDKVTARYIDAKEAEANAFHDHTSWLPPEWSKELNSLFNEYEERTTKEGIITKDADWLEQAITGLEYMRVGHDDAVLWVDAVAKALETESAQQLLAQARETDPHIWWQHLHTPTHTKLSKEEKEKL